MATRVAAPNIMHKVYFKGSDVSDETEEDNRITLGTLYLKNEKLLIGNNFIGNVSDKRTIGRKISKLAAKKMLKN